MSPYTRIRRLSLITSLSWVGFWVFFVTLEWHHIAVALRVTGIVVGLANLALFLFVLFCYKERSD